MKFLKPFAIGLVILVVYSCTNNTKTQRALIDFVPEDTQLVFKIASWDGLQTDIANNSLIAQFSDTKVSAFFSEKSTLLHYLEPTSPALLAINKLSDSTAAYTVITRLTDGLFETDSIANKSIETLTYDDISIQRVTIDDQIAFIAVQDSIFIGSSSQRILQDILKGNTEKTETFEKVYSVKSEADFSILYRADAIAVTDSTKYNLGSWATLDLTVLPNGITGTGVLLAQDTVPQLLSVFKGQVPQQNTIANVIPTDALDAVVFTYNDASALKTALRNFEGTQTDPSPTGIFETLSEIGSIELKNGIVVAANSTDAMLTHEALAPFLTEVSSFREVTIYSFSEEHLFSETMSPLIPKTNTAFAIQLDSYFVFTPTEDLANQMIIAYKNNDILAATPYYKEAASRLSTSASLVVYKMNGSIGTALSRLFTEAAASEIRSVSIKKYPLAVVQLVHDRDFAHINLVCKEISNGVRLSGSVSEEFTIQLEQEILGPPTFFSNHRTKGQDVVVQDVTNTLHLISAGGKVLWDKKLDGPILGGIEEVDLLRNGKKQLAFTTPSTFYVLDRNGSEVAPFPIKFKDKVTQPLSIFDYDNNRRYRFVITQGDEVLMYDRNAKIVSGFTFKNASSAIVQPPKHIRMGNKDYIVIPEENGKLNILSRVGKSRVTVSKKYDFSEIPITYEGNEFVVITKEMSKERISQSGKTASQPLNVSNSYWFTSMGRTKVTLDDNLLRINGKLVELPFGVYTRPTVLSTRQTTYIALTETQENKVYVFTKDGTLVTGFPIYGGSIPQLAYDARTKKILLTTQGDNREIIVYKLH